MHIIAFLVLILRVTLSTACFYGEGALNVTGKWATLLFQILKVTRIKSWHQIKLSCIASLPLSKLQVVSTIRWWLLLPNSFHFTVHRSYHLKLYRLFYWQHHYINKISICECVCVPKWNGPGQLSRYSDLLQAGWSGDWILMGARLPHTSRPGLLFNGYHVSFPRVKWRGRGVDHRPPSSAKVKERI
jgi:hypothetical protein